MKGKQFENIDGRRLYTELQRQEHYDDCHWKKTNVIACFSSCITAKLLEQNASVFYIVSESADKVQRKLRWQSLAVWLTCELRKEFRVVWMNGIHCISIALVWLSCISRAKHEKIAEEKFRLLFACYCWFGATQKQAYHNSRYWHNFAPFGRALSLWNNGCYT